jgi:peptidoglycan hydrolase CwlO-like protein
MKRLLLAVVVLLTIGNVFLFLTNVTSCTPASSEEELQREILRELQDANWALESIEGALHDRTGLYSIYDKVEAMDSNIEGIKSSVDGIYGEVSAIEGQMR